MRSESTELSWLGLAGMIRQEWPIGRMECEISDAPDSVSVVAIPAKGESRVVAQATRGTDGNWTLEATWPIQGSAALVGLGEHAACWFTLVRLLRDGELREQYGGAASAALPKGFLSDGSLALARAPEPSETGAFWTPETYEDLLARTTAYFAPVFVGRVEEASQGTVAFDPSIPGEVRVFTCDFNSPPHFSGSFESMASALADRISRWLPLSILA